MTLFLGLLLAGLAALITQVGFLLRHRGAVAAPDVDVRHPVATTAALFRQKWWSIGYGLAVVAYVCHVGALTLAALSLVQAVLAGGLVVLGVVAERFFGFQLERRQWAGVVLTSVGLALLAVTGEARSGQDSADYSIAAMLAFEAGLVGIGAALILSCRDDGRKSQHGILLGVASGLLFTTTHVAVKALRGKIDTTVAEVLMSPYLYMAMLGGIVAFFASAQVASDRPRGAGHRRHRDRGQRVVDTRRNHRVRRPGREPHAGDRRPDVRVRPRDRRGRADPRADASRSNIRGLADRSIRTRARVYLGTTMGGATRAGSLPSPGTSFVGREAELAALTEAAKAERLLTLHGAGGAGKTRLAVEFAGRLAPSMPGGVWFADLAPLERGSSAWPALAQS